MRWLYEDPWTISGIGIAAACVLGIIFAQLSQRAAALAVALTALATGGMLLIEQRVVTDFEQVESILHSAADAAVANDEAALLGHLAPSATDLRGQISGWLRSVEVHQVKINGLKVHFNDLTSPPSAAATFRTTAKYSFGGESEAMVLLSFELMLERRAGQRWLITSGEGRIGR